MNKIVDPSGEWIVDGDLYLIKTISRYPILWDRSNYDSDMRNQVWFKLSDKLKIKLEWLKKRWSYLREQYVKHLKHINNLELDRRPRKTFKYFNEMSFLADHIQIRKGTYPESVYNNVYDLTNAEDDKPGSNNHTTDVENFDFVITEHEIESYNDDDNDMPDNLFVELSDEEKGDKIFHKNNKHLDLTEQQPCRKRRKGSDSFESNDEAIKTDVKLSNSVQLSFEHLQEDVRITELHADCATQIDQPNYHGDNIRCEDTIFGELVTSMLKKMDTSNRKRAKKEILNILLS